MNKPNRIPLAKVRTFPIDLLGIVAWVGIGSLIALPRATTTGRGWGSATFAPATASSPTPCLVVKPDRYDFKSAVLEYRKKSYLDPPTFLISLDSRGPSTEMNIMLQEISRWDQFKSDVIAEAKRQEAQEQEARRAAL